MFIYGITILFLFICLFSNAQSVTKNKPIVKDSIVEITYTDGTKRTMVWINDSTVLLKIGNTKGKISSKAYIDSEFAEKETEKYFILIFLIVVKYHRVSEHLGPPATIDAIQIIKPFQQTQCCRFS